MLYKIDAIRNGEWKKVSPAKKREKQTVGRGKVKDPEAGCFVEENSGAGYENC